MNQTISLRRLVELVIEESNIKDNDIVENFVDSFFKCITENLAKEGKVKIKGFGIFTILPDKNNRQKIHFLPDSRMADIVNEPFSFFEPVELHEEVDDAILNEEQADEIDSEITNIIEPTINTESQIDSNNQTSNPDNINSIDSDSIAQTTTAPQDISIEISSPEKIQDESNPQSSPALNSENEETEFYSNHEKHFPIWLAIVIGLLVGFIAGFLAKKPIDNFLYVYENNAVIAAQIPIENDNSESITEITDSIFSNDCYSVIEDIIEPIITDTITTTRFLTTISRKHFNGIPEYWVYIYIENRETLGNPNTIAPNTVVIIPNLNKYGVDTTDPESVEKAKQMANEIYSKYK